MRFDWNQDYLELGDEFPVQIDWFAKSEDLFEALEQERQREEAREAQEQEAQAFWSWVERVELGLVKS